MAIPLLIPAITAGVGFVKGYFSGSDDDDNNNSGATGSNTGKYFVYGLAAVGVYTVYKGGMKVIKQGSGG